MEKKDKLNSLITRYNRLRKGEVDCVDSSGDIGNRVRLTKMILMYNKNRKSIVGGVQLNPISLKDRIAAYRNQLGGEVVNSKRHPDHDESTINCPKPQVFAEKVELSEEQNQVPNSLQDRIAAYRSNLRRAEGIDYRNNVIKDSTTGNQNGSVERLAALRQRISNYDRQRNQSKEWAI